MSDSAENIKKLDEELHTINELIDDLKKIGAHVEPLEKVANRLQIALDTGVDLGNAAGETSAAIAAYSNDVYQACGDDAVCQAKFDRVWQARAVSWTFDISNKKSVVRNFIKATLQRYLPQRICEHLDACRAQSQ
jgi:hypothetical protein